jgi:hypothetical protein
MRVHFRTFERNYFERRELFVNRFSVEYASKKHDKLCLWGNSRFLERMSDFMYLGKTATDPNYIDEEVKSVFNLKNDCYCKVQNLVPSYSLYKM